MNYKEALAYLSQLGKFGMILGMERIQGLLGELDNPQNKIKTIHVTGTNGKGSVTAFLSSILLSAKLRVGTFTSPHFVKYNERITLNGEEISDEEFAALATAVAQAEEKMKAKGGQQPSQFEVLTAMGFLFFANKKVDYAVIEVGMGGLWDSTNVIVPQVSIITNVTLEHTAVLGNTVAAIAEQKAGIVKPSVPVVTACQGEALDVVRAKAEECQAPLYVCGKDFTVQGSSFSARGQSFVYQFGEQQENFAMSLLGDHQLSNGAVALTAAKILAAKEPALTAEAITVGMSSTLWPGRLEIIRQEPIVLLDGAHNPSGVTVLRQALDKYFPTQKRFFIFGMMADKDMQKVASILFRPTDKVLTVLADDSPRAATAKTLEEIIGSRAKAYDDVFAAYRAALDMAENNDLICLCGSLYLVGTFKTGQVTI